MTTSPSLPVPAAPAHLPLVPAGELARRAGAIAERLRRADLSGAFLLHPSSGFWISGTLAQAWPYVDADATAVLPLRTSRGRAANESPLPSAHARHAGKLPGALADLGVKPAGRVGLELDVVPVSAFEQLKRAFPDVELVDASLLIRDARAVKSDYEIAWIEKAGHIVGRAMDEALPPRVRRGVTEIELMAFLEGHMRANRHQGVVRLRRWNLEMHYGTVSAGASASYPCYFDGPDGLEGLYPAVQQGGGERVVEPHVPVMVDVVGAAGGYLADRTRVFCVGAPPREAADAHDFCREILAALVERMRPGAVPAQIYDEVMGIVAGSPWGDRFMGWGENQVGFLGHGIGIDLDELPVIAARFEMPLEVGHVVALEPKVFLGGVGGVGVENTYVVTEGGCRDVTPGPEEIRIVTGTGSWVRPPGEGTIGDPLEERPVDAESGSTTQKLFTPAQANRALPLVRSIVCDILEKSAEFRGRTTLSADPSSDPELKELRAEVQRLIEELEFLGCEFKDPGFDVGLVDFPAKIGGRLVLLCWRSDEDQVAHYHTAGEGFLGRKPIPANLLEDEATG